jgi:hypothetical protein
MYLAAHVKACALPTQANLKWTVTEWYLFRRRGFTVTVWRPYSAFLRSTMARRTEPASDGENGRALHSSIATSRCPRAVRRRAMRRTFAASLHARDPPRRAQRTLPAALHDHRVELQEHPGGLWRGKSAVDVLHQVVGLVQREVSQRCRQLALALCRGGQCAHDQSV